MLSAPTQAASTIDGVLVCDTTDYGWYSSCLTSCSSLNVTGTYPGGDIADGGIQLCQGQVTKAQYTVRKIQVLTNAGASCSIFEGEATFDFGAAVKDQVLLSRPLDWTSCPDGAVFDRMLITTDRMFTLAGNTTYPDGSGKIARTTSTCASDSVQALTDFSWLDTFDTGTGSFNDATLCDFRPTETWRYVARKAELSPSTTNYSSSSDYPVTFDNFKARFHNSVLGPAPYVVANGLNVTSDGYYLGGDESTSSFEYAEKLDPTDSSRVVHFYLSGGSAGLLNIFNGAPLDKSKTQTVKVAYNAGRRNGYEYGLEFVWRRVGTTATLLGFKRGGQSLTITVTQD